MRRQFSIVVRIRWLSVPPVTRSQGHLSDIWQYWVYSVNGQGDGVTSR